MIVETNVSDFFFFVGPAGWAAPSQVLSGLASYAITNGFGRRLVFFDE